MNQRANAQRDNRDTGPKMALGLAAALLVGHPGGAGIHLVRKLLETVGLQILIGTNIVPLERFNV